MEKTKNCKKCNNENAKLKSKLMFAFALYILATSIYGTVVLVKNIINFF